jgi:hypothetical protein
VTSFVMGPLIHTIVLCCVALPVLNCYAHLLYVTCIACALCQVSPIATGAEHLAKSPRIHQVHNSSVYLGIVPLPLALLQSNACHMNSSAALLLAATQWQQQ